ncbi:hypothetical protein HOLleu_13828 [Holothuria leucospilota]|uniref:Uncharacterized protein n=1 Tax=Holothuria leucospilota TaxID=206669 RepID=A0A9Q1H8J1_HOLLE|nr:hypothetical protein HOLleu_13828 [Holothuria leucospilota]
MKQDAVCGQDVRLPLPQSLPHSSYNVSQQGEVALYYLTITDHTLADELPNCLKEQVATIYQHLIVSLPVIIGTSEEHGVMSLHLFTNSTKKVSVPLVTSSSEVTYVESIEEEENGTLTFLLDGDVMSIQVQEKLKAKDEMSVGKDFDKINGKVITATNYPLPFDWGCELFGSHISFCQVLKEVSCDLAAVEGDVCALSTTSSGERSPASMKIVNMTGIFRDMMPYLAEAVPLESIEAESISREHASGISQQQFLPNIRWFKSVGVAGRFVVNRDALEQVLRNRKQQDAACGQAVKLQLPQSLPHSSYNVSQQGEVSIFYGTVTDKTLSDELPNCLKDKVATSSQQLVIAIPVILGMTEEHGLLFLHLFSNSKKVQVPYSTSNNEVTHVDSIEDEEYGRVTLRLGGDIITIQIQEDAKADDEMKVDKDFDEVYGETVTFTHYPLSFDWGCALLGSQISFCQVLNNIRCELATFGGDVCVLSSVIFGERSPTDIKVVNMTGIFRDRFPYLAETVPSQSFEAENLSRELLSGIKFPCLNP